MENPNLDNAETVKNPSPFITFTARTIPATFDTSMSYQEALYALVNYLQTQVVPTVNDNAKLLQELKDFTVHYFDNLDVQEEINHKLDDMAESGELTELIAQYLQLAGVLAYDTKAAMKTAENLAEGSICKTLGDSSMQDGKGAFYKVREVDNDDIIDEINLVALSDLNLVAEKIKDNNDVKVNSNVQLTLLGRTLHKNGITNQRDYNATAHYFSMTNGGCAISENLYAICYIETNVALKDDNMAKLEIIDLRDGSVEDSVIFEGGHCNKVFYNPETEKLYTVDCYYLVNGIINETSNIHEFDVNDLSNNRLIEPTITDDSNKPMNHFEYDKVTGKYYAGSILSDGTTLQINEIDFTDFSTIRKFYIQNYRKYNNNTNGVILQNMVINNDRIYVALTGAQVIKVYDMTGSLVEIINLPKTIDSIFRLAELEGFSIYNDRFYCNAWENINNLRNSINTFFTFSLNENSPKTENEYFSSSLTIYVDKETPTWCPKGTQDLPFNEIYEIQTYLTSPELKATSITVDLKQNASPDEYDRFSIFPDVTIAMECRGNKISGYIEGNVAMYSPKTYKSNPNDWIIHIASGGTLKLFTATFEEEFVENMIINNFGKLVFAENNQYELTDKSKKLINLSFGSELITNLDIAQIAFASANTYLYPNQYKINKSTIDSPAIAAYDYNDYMNANGLNPLSSTFDRFKKLIIEYSFPDSGLKYYKTAIKRDYINVSDVNMSDSGQTYMNIYEMTIQFTAYHINVLHNKSYDMLNRQWDTTTQLMKLQNIWLA